MISRYFGLPGCGKTTFLAAMALKAIKSGKYKHVYANVYLAIPGVVYVPFDCFGRYELEDCIYFVDEATVNVGDRDFKAFTGSRLQYACEHRHHRCDLVLFSQEPDGVDKKMRSLSARMYWVYTGFWTRRWLSSCCRVPYGILWPEGRSGDGENAGRILMGYSKPPWYFRLFARRLIRPFYYKYFDSWECVRLPPLPDKYQPYGAHASEEPPAPLGEKE